MKVGTMISPPPIYASVSQTGISDEAIRLRQHWQDIFTIIMSSVAMGTQYRHLQMVLATLAKNAVHENWDGQGAAPINERALDYARRVVQMLPVTTPAPEVTVDPDGEVSFDWRADSRRSLSVSIDPLGTLRYASIVGGSENFGAEPWRDGLPESILGLLQKVVVHEATR